MAELYRNNMELLRDEEKIKQFSTCIVSSINDLDESNYMRCQLLECFKVLTYYKKTI